MSVDHASGENVIISCLFIQATPLKAVDDWSATSSIDDQSADGHYQSMITYPILIRNYYVFCIASISIDDYVPDAGFVITIRG